MSRDARAIYIDSANEWMIRTWIQTERAAVSTDGERRGFSHKTNGFRIDPPTRSGHIESDGPPGDRRGQSVAVRASQRRKAIGKQPLTGPRREVEQVYSSTGTQWDLETSGCYYRHRYYHAQLGRFGSRDPVYSGANLYRYCGDNPAIHVDPSGTHYWDYVRKLRGEHIYKAIGGTAGAVLQLGAWFENDLHLQVGVETGLYFFPDTCEIGLFSVQMGVVKELDPNGGPPKMDWEGGVQAGISVNIEYAKFTGPGDASVASFAGIFYTAQVSGGTGIGPGFSGYEGASGPNGAYWYGGTLGVGVGLPIQVGTAAWNYQCVGSVDLDDGHGWFLDTAGYCECLALILAMPL